MVCLAGHYDIGAEIRYHDDRVEGRVYSVVKGAGDIVGTRVEVQRGYKRWELDSYLREDTQFW